MTPLAPQATFPGATAAAGDALRVAGETLLPLADRALLWPRQRCLIVADVHLGKAAAFRRAGVPVPSGATRTDLDRLDRLLRAHDVQRLVILGDLFHTALTAREPAIAAIEAFRQAHPQLEIRAIVGNHDRQIERLPAAWRIDWIAGQQHQPPFVFAHEPASDARGFVLAGHLHPVVRLRSRRDSARLPVFWFRHAERIGVLPSFGSFTGGWPVVPAGTDTVIAVTPDGVVRLQSGDSFEAPAPCMS